MNPHAYITDPDQIRAVESIKRVDERGYLYHMDCGYDYSKVPDGFKAMLSAGCSAFVTKNPEGDVIYCRNYDFSHYLNNEKKNPRTGINVIIEAKNPSARYRSLGVADAYWIDFKNGSLAEGVADDGKTDLSAFVLCPYLCMDGVNEKGLAVCILSLKVESEWREIPYETYRDVLNENSQNYFYEKEGEEPSPYILRARHGSVAVNEKDRRAWVASQRTIETKNEGKQTVFHPILMRAILDNCGSVDEAVALAGKFNVKGAMPGADYHLFVADSTGDSRVIEWVGDEMAVTRIDHVTNHYVAKEDPFYAEERCSRDFLLEAGLYRTRKGGMREDMMMNLMGLVIQDPDNGQGDGKTQYSCVYNLTKGTMRIFSFGDLSKHWDYVI